MPAEQRCPARHGRPEPHWQSPSLLQLSASVASHITHASPPIPQYMRERLRHVLPWQQPPGHDAAVHVHVPPTHSRPDVHAAPLPHEHAPVVVLQLFAVSALHITHAAPPTPH